MAGRLEGKSALVIGAGSSGPGWGNGKASAVLFAREGASVVCVDRLLEAAQETAAIIVQEGGQAFAIKADATVDADVRAVMDETVRMFGGIDILDNNVGITGSGGVVELPEEEFDRVMALNLKSAFLAMKHVIPLMERAGGGSIVNISSVAAIRYLGVPYAGYYASKAALNHLTRATAAQYAPQNIRVNTVLPGLMKTPMVAHTGLASAYDDDIEKAWQVRDAQVPMGHQGTAWDVAEAALFLVSDAAAYITGLELVVDGGLSLKCT